MVIAVDLGDWYWLLIGGSDSSGAIRKTGDDDRCDLGCDFDCDCDQVRVQAQDGEQSCNQEDVQDR